MSGLRGLGAGCRGAAGHGGSTAEAGGGGNEEKHLEEEMRLEAIASRLEALAYGVEVRAGGTGVRMVHGRYECGAKPSWQGRGGASRAANEPRAAHWRKALWTWSAVVGFTWLHL